MVRDLSKKAKPCPLCGSTRIYSDYPVVDYMYSISIFCADCGLKGFKNFTKDVSEEEGTKRVIDYWNTRHQIESEVIK